MRVGFDCDGIMYDFADSVRYYLVNFEHYDPARCTAPRRWEFYEDWGLSTEQFIDVCHRGVDAGVIFTYGAPEADAREAMMMVKDAGHTVHIVTDASFGSPGAAAHARIGWLRRYGLPFDSITFASDKRIANVATMLDDKLQNYEQLTDAGVWAFLRTRPWNMERPGTPPKVRVNSMLEYARLVCGDSL